MRSDSGFSLLEALVAIAIVSASLGLLMQGLSTSTLVAKQAEDKYQAMIFAQTNIQRVGYDIALEPGLLLEVRGQYDWELEISAMDLEAVNDGPLEIFEVRSKVVWGAKDERRFVELVTVKSGGARKGSK